MTTGSGIQVIGRAAAILRACSAGTAGQSLGDISKTVSLSRSTVQRIVNALVKEGLLRLSASSSSKPATRSGLNPFRKKVQQSRP